MESNDAYCLVYCLDFPISGLKAVTVQAVLLLLCSIYKEMMTNTPYVWECDNNISTYFTRIYAELHLVGRNVV